MCRTCGCGSYYRRRNPWTDPQKVLQDLKSTNKAVVRRALTQLDAVNLSEVSGPLFVNLVRQIKVLGNRPRRYNPVEESIGRLAKKARRTLIRRRMAQKREDAAAGMGMMDYGLDEAMSLRRNPVVDLTNGEWELVLETLYTARNATTFTPAGHVGDRFLAERLQAERKEKAARFDAIIRKIHRRTNPAMMDSLNDMGLSYDYSKPAEAPAQRRWLRKRNPWSCDFCRCY